MPGPLITVTEFPETPNNASPPSFAQGSMRTALPPNDALLSPSSPSNQADNDSNLLPIHGTDIALRDFRINRARGFGLPMTATELPETLDNTSVSSFGFTESQGSTLSRRELSLITI